ncbi:hypothetical protein CCZ01_01515 [Helicobacter monodelphidis]|uniref:DMT family transporter n=1 Tax=Helicobacter sp. 15-1451 TaxID=2004995 RepID=UPI000DCDDA62|nr:multidrug efflux SMR transporter [Helicobacter sp. 15-1451]RAX58899.1 hypothetical protein CCZ01_01515 [Helicobacter sp. 15-1451]
MKYWVFLVVAIVLETIGTTSLKQAATTSNHLFTLIFALAFVGSFTLFWNALKGIDLSIAYAIWAGAGVVFISLLGIIVFKEEITFPKLIFIGFILVGVVGLKLNSKI